jgi:hypothetical protein
MLHHGTGEQTEVGATGRPWVADPRGWRPSKPPIIYVDKKEFLAHCARQPGTLPGREVHGVLDHLKWTTRRPRWDVPGMARRPSFMEIDAEQFDAYEWGMIIDVTRRSYEISQGNRGIRVVRDAAEGGVDFGGEQQREAR